MRGRSDTPPAAGKRRRTPASRPAPLLAVRAHHATALQRARIDLALARPGPESVHDLRVALRRTTALSGLTRGIPAKGSGADLAKESRALRRHLTERRTREVLVAKLAERFARDRHRRAAAIRTVRLVGEGAAADPGPGDPRFERSIARLRGLFADRDRELGGYVASGRAALEDSVVKRRVARRAGKLARRLAGLGLPDRETLHEFRIAAKKVRYALELVDDPARATAPLLETLKAFQELSGDAHDRIELVDAVRRLAATSSSARPLVGPLESDARRAVSDSISRASLLFPLLDAVIAALRTAAPGKDRPPPP